MKTAKVAAKIVGVFALFAAIPGIVTPFVAFLALSSSLFASFVDGVQVWGTTTLVLCAALGAFKLYDRRRVKSYVKTHPGYEHFGQKAPKK
jgi:uncharacterized membrane-anchored protein